MQQQINGKAVYGKKKQKKGVKPLVFLLLTRIANIFLFLAAPASMKEEESK